MASWAIPMPLLYLQKGMYFALYFSQCDTCFISCIFLVSACERLILLHHDPHELRDYAALLFHCGYYEDCLHYLSLYQTAKVILSGMTPYHGSEPENVKLTNITLHCFFAGWAIPDEPIGDLGGRSCEYSQGAGNPYFSRGWLEQQM